MTKPLFDWYFARRIVTRSVAVDGHGSAGALGEIYPIFEDAIANTHLHLYLMFGPMVNMSEIRQNFPQGNPIPNETKTTRRDKDISKESCVSDLF